MTPATLDLITKFGLPIAMLLIVVWTGKRGDWVFGWLYREAIQRLNVDLANVQNEVAALKKQCREDLQKERDLSDALLGVGERVAAAAEKAAEKAAAKQ